MRVLLSSIIDRLRASFFVVPLLAVIGGVILALTGIYLDSKIETESLLPFSLATTVESARSLLSTVAGATMAFAGVAFSISLLIIQLASSQYSPRLVTTLFRDPFNKSIMALVVGTFTFCLVVLRAVRSPFEEGGTPVIPHLSVAFALVLGIATVIGIIAFIDHSAHTMDISKILENVREHSVEQIKKDWTLSENSTSPQPLENLLIQDQPSSSIRFEQSGWVQQLDTDSLLIGLPDGHTMQVETVPGRYAIEGTLFCLISPPLTDLEPIKKSVKEALGMGNTRTHLQDASYGIRQLVDIALKALSPGINDPTTAQDAIFHASAVLAEALRRDPPPNRISASKDKQLLLPQQFTHEELIRLTFQEIRRAAALHPTVCIYLLEAIELLINSLVAQGLTDRTQALYQEAALIVEACNTTPNLPADKQLVQNAYTKRFQTP